MPAPTLDAPYERFVVPSLLSYAASFSVILYFPSLFFCCCRRIIVGMHVIIVHSCARKIDLEILELGVVVGTSTAHTC